ncbi:MAG: ATP-binding cassette domain-containing protein [Planctomycetota bacterium]|nr:MAG: ATP-binding cassette domain-containing protein [Planctomycetota bacterium]
MVEANCLTKTYPDLQRGHFVALDRVSFTVGQGEIFGLLGPNGAGKTTALRILSTVLQPTRGSARVNGFDVTTHPYEVRHSIGFVSSNTAIYDRMTAWEMVAYFGKLYGMEPDRLEQRMHEVFSQFNMEEIRDCPGARMSTGMRQKVNIARAIVHDPPVLVFDEASLGLDVLAARALLKIIGDLRDQGKCIIFSTHIMREVERLCDRVGILYHGSMLAQGSLPELAERYGESDFEELFFKLLMQADGQRAELDDAVMGRR